MTEGSHQNITFLSPDAQDAKCYVYANKIKYQVWPPQTVNIKKSEKPMRVECHAPGNRRIDLEILPRVEEVAVWGSPVGAAWDYASNSLMSYPDVIAIDFSQESLEPFPAPKHNNPDVRQPESYDLEEFRPYEPRLNSDRNRKENKLLRRGESFEDVSSSDFDEQRYAQEPAFLDDDAALVSEGASKNGMQDDKTGVSADLAPRVDRDMSGETEPMGSGGSVPENMQPVDNEASVPALDTPQVLGDQETRASEGSGNALGEDMSAGGAVDMNVISPSAGGDDSADGAPVSLVPGQ
ncbi:MAG: hypothetical protein ACLFP8_00020 [Alphaproteobacteria bacterium]